ncbi:MAG: MarR family transcriptional regulator [Oliverpabstia sp.]|nr:MarR family transcriptional regulator [Lachnospiraceae bacterium]MDY5024945.1 MarR family transcriptional regulator [Oliverpabstia sp.]
MDKAYDTFHEVLVKLFNEIMDIEAKAIITPEFKDITNNDMHVIEAVGIEEPRNMSSVAKSLSITVGTLTISVNNLVKKGYIHRVRSNEDRRVVLISLTDKGKKAFNHHKKFHEDMIQSLIAGLSEKEINTLVTALTNLKEFFRNYR